MTRGDPKFRFVDLRALAVCLATGCSSTPPLPALADHAGPRKLYTLLTPGGARFKKEYHSDRLPLGTIKVSDEIWEIGDEAGAVGVADLPVVLGSYQTRDHFGGVHLQQGGAVIVVPRPSPLCRVSGGDVGDRGHGRGDRGSDSRPAG